MSRTIEFTVPGKAVPMGSKRGFVIAGRAIVSDVNPKGKKQWANAVASAAAEQMRLLSDCPSSGSVSVTIAFSFTRPKGHYGTGKQSEKVKASSPARHTQKPDADKLLRCALDAMTKIVYRDDSQVCFIAVLKQWTTGQEESRFHVTID